MSFTQANTILQVTTPFGADSMLLVRLHGEERISSLYRFDLELVSRESDLDFKKILGEGVTVKLALANGKARYFHGIVTRFVQRGRAGKLTSYRAEVHPKLWLLGKTRDSRIFQQKKVPEIVKGILADHGVTPLEDKLKGTYLVRDYCVQYEESDLDFVSRLLEDEGIYYYFKHDDGKHTLVLGDDPSAHAPCPDLAKAKYRGEVSPPLAEEDVVVECSVEQEVVAGSYALSDYNFEMPSTSLLAKVDGKDPKLKMYEYPGDHAQKSDGEDRAKLRLEAEEVRGTRLLGSSYVRAMSAGHTFTLSEHERGDANTDHVILAVGHVATGQEYSNTFEAFPKATPFRPARVTPRPVIYGGQTALVTGKSGEEIYTDKYGRIKVQFYWDRLGGKDEKSSCWVRVAQGWAGKGWGAFFLPRIGNEVVVTFLGGDPDRPLITGSVYNAEQTVPYSLPSDMTKSTVKTRSSKKGSAGNELRFEDKKDDEEVLLHAEKDQNFTVKHDFTTEVGNDMTTTVKKGNRSATVEKGDESLTVKKGNRTVTVEKGDETHSVKGKRQLKVEGDEAHETKGDFNRKVKGGYTLKVEGDLLIDCKGSVTIKAGQAISVKSGTDLKFESGTGLNCKSGTDLKCESGTGLNLKAGTMLEAKASATGTIDGGGMLTVKGGMVKIN
jgi:type VI secretion system secreted protein VgrG